MVQQTPDIKDCPIRQKFGPLMPVEIVFRWNRFTERLTGQAAVDYLRLIHENMPGEARDKIYDLPWEIVKRTHW